MRISKDVVPRMGPSFWSKNHQKCQPSLAQTYLDRQHHCYSFFKGRFLSALATIKTASLEKCEKSTKEEKRTRKVHPKMSTLTKKIQSSLTSYVRMTHSYRERRSLCERALDSLEGRLPAKINNVRFRPIRAIHSSNAWTFKALP